MSSEHQRDAAVPGRGTRSASFHSVKRPGDERLFYLTITDHASGTNMRVELEAEHAQHLARAVLAACGIFEHIQD